MQVSYLTELEYSPPLHSWPLFTPMLPDNAVSSNNTYNRQWPHCYKPRSPGGSNSKKILRIFVIHRIWRTKRQLQKKGDDHRGRVKETKILKKKKKPKTQNKKIPNNNNNIKKKLLHNNLAWQYSKHKKTERRTIILSKYESYYIKINREKSKIKFKICVLKLFKEIEEGNNFL